MTEKEDRREELARKIANARHMSKPDADNKMVLRDADGRWLFEIYTAGHVVEKGKRQ